MKKYIIPATFLAMISLAYVSCQKENFTERASHCIENYSLLTIEYSVNSTVYSCTIRNKDEWNTLMSFIIDLTKEGNTVRIMNKNVTYCETFSKETIKYITKNQKEANEWTFQRLLEGYNVTMTYNQETGEYTCIAVR